MQSKSFVGRNIIMIRVTFIASLIVGLLSFYPATANTSINQGKAPTTNVYSIYEDIALATSLTAGTLGFCPTFANTMPNQSQTPVYPTNEYGQTYGPESLATSQDTKPDLIMAVGVDGTEGYVLNEDLNPELPKTPEEALAQERKYPNGRTIPLYAVDGKTVIGKFHIGKPKVVEFDEPIEYN
ncbi:MAG: hypothetical protein FH756_18960 [Firmicutes bacterium]|nr:hypothetical protein [Bacillota bacterium]